MWKQGNHELCKTFRVMTSDEYCRHRPNEAWFTGVLSLLLLVIMRVRLLGHSALIILIRNQERERLGKKKNRVLVHREKIFFFLFCCLRSDALFKYWVLWMHLVDSVWFCFASANNRGKQVIHKKPLIITPGFKHTLACIESQHWHLLSLSSSNLLNRQQQTGWDKRERVENQWWKLCY